MTLAVLNGPTIAAAGTLSDGLDCTSGSVIRVTCPAAWTGTHMSFQISTDGVFYNDVFDGLGREVLSVVTPGAAILLDAALTGAVGYLKIRSGSRNAPLAQAAQRVFAVTVDEPEA